MALVYVNPSRFMVVEESQESLLDQLKRTDLVLYMKLWEAGFNKLAKVAKYYRTFRLVQFVFMVQNPGELARTMDGSENLDIYAACKLKDLGPHCPSGNADKEMDEISNMDPNIEQIALVFSR